MIKLKSFLQELFCNKISFFHFKGLIITNFFVWAIHKVMLSLCLFSTMSCFLLLIISKIRFSIDILAHTPLSVVSSRQNLCSLNFVFSQLLYILSHNHQPPSSLHADAPPAYQPAFWVFIRSLYTN